MQAVSRSVHGEGLLPNGRERLLCRLALLALAVAGEFHKRVWRAWGAGRNDRRRVGQRRGKRKAGVGVGVLGVWMSVRVREVCGGWGVEVKARLGESGRVTVVSGSRRRRTKEIHLPKADGGDD